MKRAAIRRVSTSRRRQMAADAAWRQRVIERDGGRCLGGVVFPAVGCVGNVEAHHIAAKGKYPEQRHDPTNGATLCAAHHHHVHNVDPRGARAAGLLR